MAIDSLGSATNSNFQSGPSINATGRADINTGSSLSVGTCDPNDKNLDIFRHELLLTRIKGRHNAYVNVISRDSVPNEGEVIESMRESSPIPSIGECVLDNSKLDMSIATYYADLGDARSDLEHYMAYNQISLHARHFNGVVESGLACVQRHLCIGTRAGIKTHRRHAFVFYNATETTQIDDVRDAARHNMVALDATVPNYIQVRRNIALAGGGPVHVQSSNDETNWNAAKVFYINIGDADWVAGTNTKLRFKHTMMEIFSHTISAEYKPKVTVTSKSSENMIEPPEFRYAGVALTDACMHAERGDTAVTVNHFSAMTTQNGPYDIYVGDDVGWMFNSERKNLCSDGNRIARNVLTYSMLYELLAKGGNSPVATAAKIAFRQALSDADTSMHARNMQGLANVDRTDRIGSLKDAESESRGKFKRFLFVPLKHGSHITKRTSIMDRTRRIGKAISSCKAYGRVDWVNGASSEM